MPYASKRICAGCKQPVVGRCDKCTQQQRQQHDGRRTVEQPWRRWYWTQQWRRASKAFLAAHPLCECEECRRTGRVTVATVVDHRIPHKGNAMLFWSTDNWRAMSKAHHDRYGAK